MMGAVLASRDILLPLAICSRAGVSDASAIDFAMERGLWRSCTMPAYGEGVQCSVPKDLLAKRTMF